MLFKGFSLTKLHCVCSPNRCCEINNDVLLQRFFQSAITAACTITNPSHSLALTQNHGKNVHNRGTHHGALVKDSVLLCRWISQRWDGEPSAPRGCTSPEKTWSRRPPGWPRPSAAAPRLVWSCSDADWPTRTGSDQARTELKSLN